MSSGAVDSENGQTPALPPGDPDARLWTPADLSGETHSYELSAAAQDQMGVAVDIPEANLDAIRSAMGLQFGQSRILNMGVTFTALRASNSGVANSGVVRAREFTLPIELCMGCLRDCASTEVAEDTDGMVELCGGSECMNDPAFDALQSGVCGNAQSTAVQPVCCTGVEPVGATADYCNVP